MEPMSVEVRMSVVLRCKRCDKFGDWTVYQVHWIYGKITGQVYVPLCPDCYRESGMGETPTA